MLNLKIHHVSVNVSNLKESQNFYLSLGFTECYNYCSPDGDVKIIHLLLDSFILELFYYSCAPVSKTVSRDIEHSKFVGTEHFSLHTDNIENAYKILNSYITCADGIQMGRTGIRFFFISDPDGNRIEIVEDNREL